MRFRKFDARESAMVESRCCMILAEGTLTTNSPVHAAFNSIAINHDSHPLDMFSQRPVGDVIK